MTDIVFQKLEERVMQVLADLERTRAEADDKRSEVEHLRNELHRISQELSVVSQEVSALKQEKDSTARAISDLLGVMDTVKGPVDNVIVSPTMLAVNKAAAAQG